MVMGEVDVYKNIAKVQIVWYLCFGECITTVCNILPMIGNTELLTHHCYILADELYVSETRLGLYNMVGMLHFQSFIVSMNGLKRDYYFLLTLKSVVLYFTVFWWMMPLNLEAS